MAYYKECIKWDMERMTEDIEEKKDDLLRALDWVIDDLSRIKKDIESGDANCSFGNSINQLLVASQLATEISGTKKALAIGRMAFKCFDQPEAMEEKNE